MLPWWRHIQHYTSFRMECQMGTWETSKSQKNIKMITRSCRRYGRPNIGTGAADSLGCLVDNIIVNCNQIKGGLNQCHVGGPIVTCNALFLWYVMYIVAINRLKLKSDWRTSPTSLHCGDIHSTFIGIPISWCGLCIMIWKPFPRYWPYVKGIHRSALDSPQRVDSPQRGLWCGILLLLASVICFEVSVMEFCIMVFNQVHLLCKWAKN